MLEALATPEVRKKLQLDLKYLIEHPDDIVPYFTSRDADEVLILLGSMLKANGKKVDVRHLTQAQQKQLQAAAQNGELRKWVANKYRNGRDIDAVSCGAKMKRGSRDSCPQSGQRLSPAAVIARH